MPRKPKHHDTVIKDPDVIRKIMEELTSVPSKKTKRNNAKAKAAYLKLSDSARKYL